MSGGVYILVIDVPGNKRIDVGRLGSFIFGHGTYLYVGSALNTLEKRINRHRSVTKKVHWHVDYLLQAASVVEVFIIKTDNTIECLVNTTVSKVYPVEVPVKGFGSSDCRCATHLWRLASRAKLKGKAFEAALRGEMPGEHISVDCLQWS